MRTRRIAAAAITAAALVPTTSGAAAALESQISRRLGDSEDIAAAARDVSQGTWDDGEGELVVLARDDVFADSLAGAALAGTDGPILFTGPDDLDDATVREIDRVLGATEDQSRCVLILGGTSAVATSIEDDLRDGGRCVERIAGTDRVGAALAVARHRSDGDPVSRVLLARADTWYDAVAAGAHAARTGDPILVTPPVSLDADVAAYLEELAPEEIVLLGGIAALSTQVEQQARTYAGTVTRIAGTTRDTTAIAVAEQLWDDADAEGITLVNGHAATGWAYAIAASVTAAREAAPVLFTQSNGTSDATRAHIDAADPAFTITAGPSRLIRPGVAYGYSPTADLHRIDPPSTSPDRYRREVFAEVTRTDGITYGTATNRSGQTVTLQLDLYEPTGDTATARPLIVWIHGGSFRTGSRTSPEIVDQATTFAERGYLSASISYRLEPGGCSAAGPTEECITAINEAHEDARTAIRFLRARAAQHRIDVDRVAVAGTSAGGITALNVGYTSSEATDPAHVVQSAVAISGAGLMGPIDAGDAPALDFHGDQDFVVPYAWAQGTVRDATSKGLLAKLTTYEGDGHVPYVEHRAEIIEQTSRFLWWTLAIDGAEGGG